MALTAEAQAATVTNDQAHGTARPGTGDSQRVLFLGNEGLGAHQRARANRHERVDRANRANCEDRGGLP